jgi:hypothetical protein
MNFSTTDYYQTAKDAIDIGQQALEAGNLAIARMFANIAKKMDVLADISQQERLIF